MLLNKTTFRPTILLGTALITASVFGLGEFGLSPTANAKSATSYGSAANLSKAGSKKSANDIAPASQTLKNGLRALDKNNFKAALKARASLRSGTLERKVMAWAIAIKGKGVDATTLHKISSDLAEWPGELTMRRNVERALVKELNGSALRVAFSQAQPETQEASIALAKAHIAAGDKASARRVIQPIWRNSKLTSSEEAAILKQIGSALTREDHQARIEYLLRRDRLRAASRLAGKAGMTRLIAARTAVVRKQKSASSKLAAVPSFQRKTANYLMSKAMLQRRAGKLTAASKTLLAINRKSLVKQAADGLWTEHRILASDLLEVGKAKTAYRLAARNVAGSDSKRIDAEFYAGWLALRKLGDAGTASQHFGRLLKIARTPLSKSRGHYWMGRALRKAGQKTKANQHYAAAAQYDTTYYGQLAARKLGRKSISISKASPSSTDRAQFPKFELVQAIQKLESAGHPRKARTIYRFLARHLPRSGKLALLAARAERQRDYQLSLQVGKTAFIRGMKADNLAWPVGAIPRNTKTSGAGLPLAYAIARQESTFQVDARSPANALGLLQLLPGTAKRTARDLGIGYSRQKLVTDPSYNARLGTAYLNKQMNKFNGSFILTFAAYNAGPSRAEDWIKRNGDPRGKSLDFVIDWVESIPFSETRNYVQRVMENYQVYKTRLKGGKLTIERDLRKG